MEEEDPENDKEDITGEDADTLDSTAMEGAMQINREGVYPKQFVSMSKKCVETLSPREARPILEREFWQYIKMIVLAIFQTRHSDKILDSTLDKTCVDDVHLEDSNLISYCKLDSWKSHKLKKQLKLKLVIWKYQGLTTKNLMIYLTISALSKKLLSSLHLVPKFPPG